MFTGIVEEIGVIEKLTQHKNLATLTLRAKKVLARTKPGDSVCVDGVCLTVTKLTKTHISFEMMRETLQATTLGRKSISDQVNLERALKTDGRLGGHFVSGHVDTLCKVLSVTKEKNFTEINIALPKSIARYIVPKGSVCINGVSLTVGRVGKNEFSVYLIPFTLKTTNLGAVQKGDQVNIETDILAKYVLNKK